MNVNLNSMDLNLNSILEVNENFWYIPPSQDVYSIEKTKDTVLIVIR